MWTKYQLYDFIEPITSITINIDKSQVMRVYKSNESLQIKVGNRELKKFKYLGSVLTRDGYCMREIKLRIGIVKKALNRKNITLDKQAKHWTPEEIGL